MRRPGLVGRLALAMSLVALVSALLAGVLVYPLLAGTARDAVRDPLANQADLFARLPRIALVADRVTQLARSGDLSLGFVSPSGEARGAATALTPGEREELLAGEDVSTDGELAGTPVIIEARPLATGGAVVLARDTQAVTEAQTLLRRRVLVAIAVGLAAALGAAALLATRIGRPLTETAAVARRMAAGERGVPLPAAGTREVADVAEALAGLDAALRSSEERQRQFLLSVSHELRTPLTAVRGYAEALADGMVAPEETAEVGRTLVGEAERLERYVADLLALARLEADDFTLDVGPVDLAELVAEAAASWRERAERAGIDVRTEAAEPVPVVTDAGRVRQVVDNLVDNAVRVSPPGAAVVIAASAAGDGARLEVRDSGPGLTEDDATVAFVPGALHERYAGSRPGGHGLGLAIVHRLTTRLGGSIAVTQAPEGGAAFVLDLPSAPK